jgi:hypothetical protein
MRHPPASQLAQHGRLAAHRHLTSLSSLHPQPEASSPGEGQIDQFDLHLLVGKEAANGEAVMWFDSLAHPVHPPGILTMSRLASPLHWGTACSLLSFQALLHQPKRKKHRVRGNVRAYLQHFVYLWLGD